MGVSKGVMCARKLYSSVMRVRLCQAKEDVLVQVVVWGMMRGQLRKQSGSML